MEFGDGSDQFSVTYLQEGDIVYGGLPGQSAWYTKQNTWDAAGWQRDEVWQALQVAPHPVLGYRPEVGAYRVKEFVNVPYGKALANPDHGQGGGWQYYIKDYEDVLELVEVIRLND